MRIIDARKKGLSIGQMDDDGLRYVCDQIIVRGAALYGCDMPQTEFFAEVLSKEFSDYLLDFGYDNLTLEEIILAMRMNANGNFINPLGEDINQTAFFGNFIHVSFLCKVLHGYMVLRNNLETKFKNHIDGY